MRTNLFIFLLLCTFFASAQKKEIKAGGSSVALKVLKMPRFPIADFPKKSMAISDIQVIQVTRDSIRLGYAGAGLDNQIVILVPTKPLGAFLQEHVLRMYKDSYKKEGAKILWVVKELRVGEKSAFMDYAYTRFNTDAYISKDGKLYKPVCSIDTVFVNESEVDVTAWHGEDIENAFRLLVRKTLSRGKEVLEQNATELTIEQIREASKPQTDFPILTDDTYREGAYANFEEFLQNKPSINDFQPIVVEKKKLLFIKTDPNSPHDTLSVWGLCKNGEIYKYDNETLIPIENQGNGFIISSYVEQANRRNGNMFFAGFVAGIAGGIIGGAIYFSSTGSSAYGKTLLVRSIPYITKPKKQPEATCIDMKTGELSF